MTREELIYEEALRHKACAELKGTEDIDELIELFFTPQGIEFCTAHNVPSLETFRRFRGADAERSGMYIDTPVKASNMPQIALIGSETVAELEYSETKGFTIVLMYGAQAKITAGGYAVVFIENAGGKVEIIKKDNAKIYQ